MSEVEPQATRRELVRDEASARESQARVMAHLRDLPRCRCGAAATKELYSGVNALIGRFCGRCARSALKAFKEGGPV